MQSFHAFGRRFFFKFVVSVILSCFISEAPIGIFLSSLQRHVCWVGGVSAAFFAIQHCLYYCHVTFTWDLYIRAFCWRVTARHTEGRSGTRYCDICTHWKRVFHAVSIAYACIVSNVTGRIKAKSPPSHEIMSRRIGDIFYCRCFVPSA